MRRAEFVTAIILAAFSLYLMWKSGEGPSWAPGWTYDSIALRSESGGMGKGFWPFYLAAGMLVSCCWILFNAIRRVSPPSQSEEPFLDGYGWRMLLLVGGGLIAFLAIIEYAGFYVGIFAFLFYYMYFLGRHSLRQTLAISIGVPVFSFFFFDILMRIVLPKGVTEPLFIPLYDMFL